MAKRSLGVRESVGPIPTSPTISRYFCDKCGNGLSMPFSASVFDTDGSEKIVQNKIIPENGRVVVYLHDSCTVAAKTSAPVIYRDDSEDGCDNPDDMIIVAGDRSYTMDDIRVVTEGSRYLMVFPTVQYPEEDPEY